MTTTLSLTAEQQDEIFRKNAEQAGLVAELAQLGALANFGFIYFAAFDGTNNDADTRPQTTNVRQLETQIESANDGRVLPQYFSGPGTRGTLRFSDIVGPQVTRQVIKRAEQAYENFASEARRRSSTNSSVSVALTSFSRGGASAAIFTQLLYANGLLAADGRVLLAPGQIPVSAGVIFDPVLTGANGNLAFAPITHNLVDILARDEYRKFFEAADYRNQSDIIKIVSMFGAHSDIGGSYDNGIAAITLEAATQFLKRAGLAIDDVPAERRYQDPLLIHSEGDSIIWTEYADFAFGAVDDTPRHYADFAKPASLTTLLGRQAKSLLLFDGRTITITDVDSAGIEKVKIDSRVASNVEAHELTTYRIAAVTDVLNKIRAEKNTRLDTQRIQAIIFDGSPLDINVPSAHSTRVTIGGVGSDDKQGALVVGEEVGGLELHGGKFERSGTAMASIWRDTEKGTTYKLVGGTLADGRGDLVISGGPLGDTGASITVEDFVDGKLGISFADKQAVRLSSTSSRLGEGGSTTLTLSANSTNPAARTFKLLATGFGPELAADVGGELRSFTAGELDVDLPDGQSQVKVALLQRGDIDVGGTFDLTATLVDAGGGAVASDTQTFTLDARGEATGIPVTSREILGGFAEGPDDLGNKFTGPFDDSRSDLLNDSSGADHIMAGGGDDTVLAARGGDDWIEGGQGRDNIDAGAGGDLLLGGDGADFLFGGDGDDRLFADATEDPDAAAITGAVALDAGPGGDFLNGNAGNDLLVGDDRANILEGGASDDRIVAGGGDDTIEADGDIRGLVTGEAFTITALSRTDPDGSAAGTVTISGVAERFTVDIGGDDLVYAGGGNDFVLVGDGDDVAFGDAGADLLFGDAGNDALFGGEGDDVLSGDNGGSVLEYAAHGADFLDGGAGDDKLFGNGGADSLFGGEGNDILIGDSSATNAGDDYLSGDDGDDQLLGGMGADTLLGGAGKDTLVGDKGGADLLGDADFLDGGEGDDTLIGQGGDDTLIGGAGDDFLQGDAGDDTLDGEEGDDVLLGGVGADTLEGGDGDDVLAGDEGAAGTSGDADYIDGGAGSDTLAGQAGDDVLSGGEGDDVIDGGDGSDFADGGSGDDRIQGAAGDDWLDGGDGADVVLGGEGQDQIDGGGGDDVLVGDDGLSDGLGDADVVRGGAGNDQLFGQLGDDLLAGDDGDDSLDGGDGNDTLDGGAGDDRIVGGAGDDTIAGGNGADSIDGGAGNDILAGGEGHDVYRYDFRNGGIDHIDDTGSNTLIVDGIAPESVRLGLGSLLLSGGDPANQIHLDDFDPDDVAAGAGIDLFLFDDGTTLTYAQLVARGFDVAATPEGEIVEGTSGDDLIDAQAGEDLVIGKAGNDRILLGDGDDVAEGGEGNDTIDGGAGADTLIGGAGDDVYVVDGQDEVREEEGGGFDTVLAALDYTLGANVERLVLTGNADSAGTGNSAGNTLIGNAGNNLLRGLEGDDILDGGGGADVLDGGAGADLLRLTGGGLSDSGTLLGGDGNDRLFGSEGNDVLDGGSGADSMRGGVGNDLYFVDDPRDRVIEDDIWVGNGLPVLRAGDDTVESAISFALPSFVEDLLLTGTESIDGAGNAERNRLEGNSAANELVSTRLDGLNDNLAFGLGATLYFGAFPKGVDERLWDRALARYFEGEISGRDLDSVGNVINVDARPGDWLIGKEGDDRLIGGWDDDLLDGGAGSDLLIGSGGHDIMRGGEGDDVYVVDGGFDYEFGYLTTAFVHYADDSLDEVLEEVDGGVDSLYSNRNEYWLDDNVEKLILLDPRDFSTLRLSPDDGLLSHTTAISGFGNQLDNLIRGNRFDNNLYGNSGRDSLFGEEGNDSLDGGGDADMMIGGVGDDAYRVDIAADAVVEEQSSGYDLVRSDIDYVLPANVEALYLRGSTFEEDLAGAGNELDNEIHGNSGDNVIAGLDGDDYLDGGEGDDTLFGGSGNDELQGAAGADRMEGGTGDDIYWVDDEGDTTVENAAEGHDLVLASLPHTLGDNLEDLELLTADFFGNFVGSVDGTGNVLANRIIGNDFENILSGLGGDDDLLGGRGEDTLFGGAGNDVLDGGRDGDVLYGGTGNDTYIVDSARDLVVEANEEGMDELQSAITFALPENVENLRLLGDYEDFGLVAFVDGSGNDLENVIVGNGGFNELSGKGGDDRIDAGAGGDVVFGDEGDDRLYGGDDAVFLGTTYRVALDFDGRQIKQPNAFLVSEALASNSDLLFGGQGNDALDGGSGNDWLDGGEGDDVVYGGHEGLSVTALSGFVDRDGEEGIGSVDRQGRLFLANDDVLHGGDGHDILDGGSGNDELHGDAGIDVMYGGTGDDRYFVDGTFTIELRDFIDECGNRILDVPTRVWDTDVVTESEGEGHDTIVASAELTLAENFEDLYLEEGPDLEFATGNALANAIVGNSGNNRLYGLDGDDILLGGKGDDVLDGGAGDDALYGDAGDDTYLFGRASGQDVVYSPGGGFDIVHLTDDIDVDELTLSTNGHDLTIGINGTSNRLALAGWFDDATARVSELEFCDGTILDELDIALLADRHHIEARDDFNSTLEDAPAITGRLFDNDFGDGSTFAVSHAASYAGEHGTLVVSEDGGYTYRPHADHLAGGESAIDIFSYEVHDEANAHDTAWLSIEIHGQNDAPAFADAAAGGAIVEDATAESTIERDNRISNGSFDSLDLAGWLEDGEFEFTGATDGPSGGVAFFGAVGGEDLLSEDVATQSGEHLLLHFRLFGGSLEDARFSARWNGETLLSLHDTVLRDYTEYTFEVEGREASSHLEFSGTNRRDFWYLDDVSVAGFDRASFTPDIQTTSGEVHFSDIDSSDAHQIGISQREPGYLGEFAATLEQDSTGAENGIVAWTFDVANSALQFLAEGQTVTQEYEIRVVDTAGAESRDTVAVVLRGANDAPVAADDAAVVSEDETVTAAGNVLANDDDPDAATTLFVESPGLYSGRFGSLRLEANGDYAYALANATPDVQGLRAGETVFDVFIYEASDGLMTSTAKLTITVRGTNDAPVTAMDIGSVFEDGLLSAAGNVLDNDTDADNQTVLSVSNAGRFGNLTLSADGAYLYTLDNSSAAVQALAAGQTVSEDFFYLATDGIAQSEGLLTITIGGANDVPLANGDEARVVEDTLITASGNVLDNDVDVDADSALAVTPASLSGEFGDLTLTGDGDYLYRLSNPSPQVQALAAGETVSDVFTYELSDGVATARADLSVTILGTNDAPVSLEPIPDARATTDTPFALVIAADVFSDVDHGDSLHFAASLADGSPLPAWLAFDDAERTLTGAPAADSTGTYTVRITAADIAGANAFQDFNLSVESAVTSGRHIVGTDGDDVLIGTAFDDVIEGGTGHDVMAGGAGNDTYYVDGTCSQAHGNEGVGNGEDPPPPGHDHNWNDGPGTSPGHPGSRDGFGESDDSLCPSTPSPCDADEVVEQAGGGHDVVYSSTDYELPDNVEELRLIGTSDLTGSGNALDNLLAGNSGDNRLVGGLGNDLYLHELHGGDDVISDAGGDDVLAFGSGITAQIIAMQRRAADLVLRVGTAHESVTLQDWFGSSAHRVETIRFADGTAWDIERIERELREAHATTPPLEPPTHEHDRHDDEHGERHDNREKSEDSRHNEDQRDVPAQVLDARVLAKAIFAFESEMQGKKTSDEHAIASQWQKGASYDYRSNDEHGANAGDWLAPQSVLGSLNPPLSSGGFGFDASIGAGRSQESLKSFHGLSEGFRRL